MTEVVVRRRRMHQGQVRLQRSPARFRVAMFGRRWGKNVAGIDEAQTTALSGKSVGWFEPTYKYLLEAWRDLANRLRPAAKHVSEQEKRIELITGGMIEAWTCDTPDPARGRAFDLVVVNEAGIVRSLLPIWQESIRPTLTDRRGRALFMGTPKGRTHDFSLLFSKAETEPEWEAFRGPTAENPHIPTEEIDAAKRELPPAVFAQEYEGIPCDDGGNPFGLDAIRACCQAWQQQEHPKPIAWGWDFARAQDWTVGIALDRAYGVVGFERWQLVPWGETKGRVVQHTAGVPAWGDSTGVGDAVVEDLQRMGCPMVGIQFSRPQKQQLMERLAGAIQQRRVSFPDGPIRSELETFGYEYTASGVRYTAPDGYHDDTVMALALAVYGRDQFGELRGPEPPKVLDDDTHPGINWERAQRKLKAFSPDPVEPRRWRPDASRFQVMGDGEV